MFGNRQLPWVAALGMLLPATAQADVFADTADRQLVGKAGFKTDPASLLDFLRKRTLTPASQKRLRWLVQGLGSPSYRVRREATSQLAEWGSLALPALQRAQQEADPEVVRRAALAVHRIREQDLGPEVTAAVLRLLTRTRPDEAAAVLLAFLPHAESDSIALQARAVLADLARRDGKPEPVLVAALKDPNPLARGAAGEALCRAGLVKQVPAVRSLLEDPVPEVRCPVARALTLTGDKKGIPVLIEGLDRWPVSLAYRALEFLYRVADASAPHVPLGIDAEARGKCRAAWDAWWKANRDKVDLARLSEKPRVLGSTILMLIDQGRVEERDPAGKVRWQFEGLQLPLDIQLLPGDRVLVAEHLAGRVTERTFKGKILWEKKIAEPLMAQRLEGGNTFIATRTQLVEFDPTGKEVVSFAPPDGGQVMKAVRLSDGGVACIALSDNPGLPRFYRLSAFGKANGSFPVRLTTSGGRIDVQPEGKVLVPEMAYHRVVEYDAEGQIVWQARVEEPIAAIRLANGHTLVTTYSQHRAVELNREGREISAFPAEGRVNRALRR